MGNVKTMLKMAAGGVVLFGAGALITALALGRVTLPQMGPLTRGQIEQVVHDYMVSHPEIIIEMSNKLDTQQQAAADKAREDALFQVGPAALIDPKVAFVTGPKDAKVTVAEFFDYRCPHCKASQAAVKHLLDKGQNIRVAFIERPILTPDSVVAAHAAVAARRQGDKYVPFHFALMATTGELPRERILDIAKTVGLDVAKLEKDMDDPSVLDSVKESNALADKLHFDGTPTFVINNHIIVGELTDEQLQQLTKAATSG
jgi:protein-disulfide isomerase